MLAWRAKPFSIGDDHEGGSEAGCMVPTITRVAQQNLKHQKAHLAKQTC